MDKPHCKNIPEDVFEKEDRHYQLQDEVEDLTGLEPLAYQQQLEKNRLHKLRKVPDEEI
jgi:hypothetical protein